MPIHFASNYEVLTGESIDDATARMTGKPVAKVVRAAVHRPAPQVAEVAETKTEIGDAETGEIEDE